jgi:hypothetical protein
MNKFEAFAVRCKNRILIEAFIELCEKLGWKWDEDFSQKAHDHWPYIIFCRQFNPHKPNSKPLDTWFSHTGGVGGYKTFNLDTDFPEALEHAREAYKLLRAELDAEKQVKAPEPVSLQKYLEAAFTDTETGKQFQVTAIYLNENRAIIYSKDYGYCGQLLDKLIRHEPNN